MRRAWLATIVSLAVATPAAAHVEILPTSAAVNEAREFTARVPNERETPTVKVKILFPPSVAVFAFAPSPGWARQELKTRDGRLRGVVYSGGKIGAGEYADFGFLGTPLREGTAAWKSEQTYADGVTKPWTGPPEKDGETAQETGPSAAGAAAATRLGPASEEAQGAARGGSSDDSSSAGIWLGLIAIAIAAGAMLGVGLLWSSRPAPLPPDEGEDEALGSAGRDRSPAPRAFKEAGPTTAPRAGGSSAATTHRRRRRG